MIPRNLSELVLLQPSSPHISFKFTLNFTTCKRFEWKLCTCSESCRRLLLLWGISKQLLLFIPINHKAEGYDNFVRKQMNFKARRRPHKQTIFGNLLISLQFAQKYATQNMLNIGKRQSSTLDCWFRACACSVPDSAAAAEDNRVRWLGKSFLYSKTDYDCCDGFVISLLLLLFLFCLSAFAFCILRQINWNS